MNKTVLIPRTSYILEYSYNSIVLLYNRVTKEKRVRCWGGGVGEGRCDGMVTFKGSFSLSPLGFPRKCVNAFHLP